MRKYSDVVRNGKMKGLQYSKKKLLALAAQATMKLHEPPASVPKSAFDLSDLPEVPLLIILRHLNWYRLVHMRRTSSWLNQFIMVNRHHLFWKTFHKVRVEQKVKKGLETTYELSIYPERDCRNPHIIYFCTKNTRPSTSFFAWFTETLSSTYIEKWELCKFSFDEELLEGVEQTMVKTELRITHIIISYMRTGFDPNSVLRFLTTLRPMGFSIYHFVNDVKRLHALFTDSFFAYMTSLRRVRICRGLSCPPKYQFPDDIQRIPEIFNTGGVFITSLSTLVKAIHTWYNCELDILSWILAIRQDACSSVEQLGKAIGLPFRKTFQEDPQVIEITNRGGKIIQLIIAVIGVANSDTIDLMITDHEYIFDDMD